MLALSTGAYPKGADYLYRVSTPLGELVASGHHLILCSDGSYQRVDNLCRGQSVCLYSDGQTSTSSTYDLSQFPLDVPHYPQTALDSADRYVESIRQYGQQLLLEKGIDPASSPSLDDAQEWCAYACEREGGLQELLQEHTHRGQLSDQSCTYGCSDQLLRQHLAEGGSTSAELFLRNVALIQQSLLSQLMSSCHLIAQQSFVYSHSSCDSLTYGAILDIQKTKVKYPYWDMQVLNTNNYVTADGLINHNSGKSVTCCFEIFLKMKNQAPDKNGKRRSRWIVTRQTYAELENTTIATWKDWFPEEMFGPISRKPPYKQHFKFDDVEAEVIFLALEKPEDQKKLLSFEVTGIFFNEAREVQWELVTAAFSRTGRYPSPKDKPKDFPKDAPWPTWSGMLMDTNPPDDTHWWYDMAENDAWAVNKYEEKVDPMSVPEEKRWEFFSQPSGLSPEAENVEHLPNGYDYYEKMLLGGNTKEWIDVHVHGKYGFIKKGMPVYEGYWNENLHTAVKPIVINPAGQIYVGVDSSGRHPAALMAQRNSHGQWQILREYCITDDKGLGAELYSKQLAQLLIEHFPNHSFNIWGDPAGAWGSQNDERTYFDILRANGIPIKGAQDALRIPDRLETVKSVLSRLIDGKPAIIIDPSCKMLLRGFNGGYKYKQISSGGDTRYDEKPDKTNRFADVHDALQYLLCGAGEGRKLKRGKSKFRGGSYQARVTIPTI